MRRDPKFVSDMAFTWAAFSAAETLLHGISRKSAKTDDHADLLIQFLEVGDQLQSPAYFIDKTIELQSWLQPYRAKAIRIVAQQQTQRGILCAK
ncbi:MAG: hypothetical protein JKY47_03840 [Thalassospira sp.]|uniref:hypothetical protein n=1 Tax=Thalassospira sp. 11-3 TaxID=2135614 RepID=UPI000D75745B|nr:hypothetical protein [Thalassospira sp. 11-3]MBL4839945.1 hypothetical protein [Thalassospira sp.]PXX30888.1 hypothetical protein C7967_106148 [Thalassospira sp. 11-3]